MDEYNPMNYNCEPVEENQKQDRGYDPGQYRPYDPEQFRRQEEARSQGYEPYGYSDQKPPKKPKKDRTVLKIVALVAVVAILGSVGGALLTTAIDKINDPAEEVVAEKQEEPAVEEAADYEMIKHELPEKLGSYDTGKTLTPVQVYELTVNSVVGIRTESTINAFGQEAVSASAGSGFILSEDGYVITNAHVVSGAQTIKVDLFNGESYDAQLVGADSGFDIAVLKMEAEGLQPVSVGNSDDLKVGEEVAAIGNPLGELTITMTSGILSALDREINTDGNPQNMIQTNAAINSGNSGGPLFDMDGNVIGVTTAKYSGSSFSGASIEGLGFAIPSAVMDRVVNDLLATGETQPEPLLGISVMQVATEAEKGVWGLEVAIVEPDSAAARAGIQVGDYVITAAGQPLATSKDLLRVRRGCYVGEQLEMTIWRDGVLMDVTLDLQESTEE